MNIAANNLIITPKVHLSFNHVLAIDPLRNIFSSEYGNGNDNNAMLFFLQKILEKLRSTVNPDACIVLTHHAKRLSKNMLEEDPFQGLQGAGFLWGFYSTGMVMFGQDKEHTARHIVFELRNDERVSNKLVDKIDGHWPHVDQWNN